MAWELLAIWAIVITTVTWFIRDEKRLGAERAMVRATAYYAHAARYRHVPAEPQRAELPTPSRRPGGLTAQQRDYLKALQRR